MNRRFCACVLLASLAMPGCATAPRTQVAKAKLGADVGATIERFNRSGSDLQRFFDEAYGYAVFPSVGKGAVGIGGAYGRGELFEQGQMVGFCDLSQGTIGLQLGGQAYSEIIFFEYKEALDHFKTGNFALAAQVSAVVLEAGASAEADYDRGVVVFTMPIGGLMFEASVGGQQFRFEPKRPDAVSSETGC